MDWQNILRILKSDYLKLLLIMGLAFYIAFIPHQNYPYPLHFDEWTHLALSKQIINQAGAVGLIDPFSGGEPILNQLYEVGFHVFWAVFHQISGVSWLAIFRYFPGIIFIITVLSVYIATRRAGFGLEAAFFTCLILSMVGILGPAFMVPIALGLLFIPLALFLVFYFRGWLSYVVLFIFMCFLVSIHGATAVNLIIILIPCILFNLKGDFRHSLGITLALLAPFLVAVVFFPWIIQTILITARSLLIPKPVLTFVDLPRIIQAYGYLPILLCLLGIFVLVMKGGKQNYSLVLGLLAMLAMLSTFYTLHYGEGAMYYRGIVHTMLLIGIIAGAGLMTVRNLKLPDKFNFQQKVPFITRNLGKVLCLILIVLILFIAIPDRQDTPYYAMIDGDDYQAFVWVKENIDDSYQRAILDPWKASAFTAVTGKKIYTRIGEYPKDIDLATYDFLDDGCQDTAFLRENEISIVYTRQECHNPDLEEVREYVYLLKEVEESR